MQKSGLEFRLLWFLVAIGTWPAAAAINLSLELMQVKDVAQRACGRTPTVPGTFLFVRAGARPVTQFDRRCSDVLTLAHDRSSRPRFAEGVLAGLPWLFTKSEAPSEALFDDQEQTARQPCPQIRGYSSDSEQFRSAPAAAEAETGVPVNYKFN